MIEQAVINRLRLWLRSERAFGLPAVGPGAWSDLRVTSPTPLPRSSPAARVATAPPARAPAVRSSPVSAPPPASSPARPAQTPVAPVQRDDAPFASPVLSADDRRTQLATLDENEVRGCTKCTLCNTRNRTVFGEGAADARLMFIGEGPGGKEDQTGRPFVGPAGELLNRMIVAMGLLREQVYIANVVKCRAFIPGPPPKDRAPAPDEVAACASYIERQVELVRPQVIVTLGVPATQFVLATRLPMSKLRGTWSAWHGIKVMPTWHPSYLLRREKDGDLEPKRQAWSDLQKVMAELGLSMPKKGS